MEFSTTDLWIFAGWLIFMMGFGIWISKRKKQESAQDYFLASKALPWWAVGGSLIASNISAEQFIGMSGSGYVVGLAIASYEFMAAATLIIVAKYFLPVFLKKGIYTMPQFLEQRFDSRVRTGLAIFWVLLFVFVNITSVLYLGGLALQSIMGIPLIYGVIGLALFASTFSITGGLKAVVWTDVIQVIVLIFGGLLASVMVLKAVGGSFWVGLETLIAKAPEKFEMILHKSNPEYINLPGISVLIGGMWIANLYYWGNNQYIIQRALAAKNLKEAQNGTVFAAFLKVLLPLIVVIPGIAAFVLNADVNKPDEAYPWVLNNYVATGFKGLAFAALIAAIGSSLSSMVNSASTIFTLDIYRPMKFKNGGELSPSEDKHLVRIGKISAALSLCVGVLIAPLLGNLDQAFQYIQEYTGFISPGVVAIFLFGLFWKRTSTNAALLTVILSIPLSAAFKFFWPELPFIDRMGLSFLILSAVIIIVSLIENRSVDQKAIQLEKGGFRTSSVFNLASVAVVGVLAVIYVVFW
ncbi:sodium/sugar symporter [Xanthovirga aplysinae]|uniref:sodium/sugar symporter n=1 Tax=Xanthovirga aplysinae TaxID=2529853 RepID=UPI0012BC4B7B|nr:sodium/sugar symporter [Xanthovirga aplysinae]MTI30990.1 sodium/glucose cotransporter [Xanthovirga aplysinae]